MRAIFLTCALAISGCGGDTGAVDDFISKMAQAQCQWQYRCCTDAEIKQQTMGKYMDEPTCEKFAQLALQQQFDLQRLGVSQGRLTVDKAAVDACVAEQAMKACNPPPGTTPPPNPMGECTMDPCLTMFKGSTGANQACLIPDECAKGSHCVGAGNGTEGVCQPFQEENQICNSSSDCDPLVCNLYCAHQDFQCHVRSPLGGPCAYTIDPVTGNPIAPLLIECDPGDKNNVFCDPGSSTCQQLPGAGQPCLVPAPPGVFSSCDPDPTLELFCDQATMTCKAPGMVGDPCTTSQQCSRNAMLYCDRTTTPGKCAALPTLGQSCSQTGQCQMPYFCNFSKSPIVCDQPAQLGQACSFQQSCATGLYCATNNANPTCMSQLATGSPCTSSQMCLSGFCQFTTGGMGVCGQGTVSVMCIGRM
jgi:hypothetical protein